MAKELNKKISPFLSILMPVFNERHRVKRAIEVVFEAKLPWPFELIIVDDGSTDGTTEILQETIKNFPNTIFIRASENKGKGSAVRIALEKATGDYCIIQDADLEYDPKDIPSLLEPLLSGEADIVYGSRFLGHGARSTLFYWHALGNKLITLIINAFGNIFLTDVETGYKVFRTKLLKAIPLKTNGFSFEVEVTLKASRLGHVIYEIPISYHGRTYNDGKKNYLERRSCCRYRGFLLLLR
jgi:glycosyltransferase involved in cell wall biosynthesis